MVQRDIFAMRENLTGLILDSAIYRGSLFSDQNVKMYIVGAREDLKGCTLVQRHIFSMCEDLAGLILNSTIYRGSLFSDRNGKMGFVGAREDLKG